MADDDLSVARGVHIELDRRWLRARAPASSHRACSRAPPWRPPGGRRRAPSVRARDCPAQTLSTRSNACCRATGGVASAGHDRSHPPRRDRGPPRGVRGRALEQQAVEERFQIDVFLGDVAFETSYSLPGEDSPPRVRADLSLDWPTWSQSAYRSWSIGEPPAEPPELIVEIALQGAAPLGHARSGRACSPRWPVRARVRLRAPGAVRADDRTALRILVRLARVRDRGRLPGQHPARRAAP